MKRFLDMAFWRAAVRNPLAMAGLALDLAPAIAVLFWGWTAAPLLALYWLENVVLGVATAPRIIMAAIARSGWVGAFQGAFLTAFFAFHYGLFCLVHGGILLTFLTDHDYASGPSISGMIAAIFSAALSLGRHMDWMLGLLIAFYAATFARDLFRHDWAASKPDEEMFAPYGRIIALHFGIFALGGLIILAGDIAAGALALILLRALWRLHGAMRPSAPIRRRDVAPASP